MYKKLTCNFSFSAKNVLISSSLGSGIDFISYLIKNNSLEMLFNLGISKACLSSIDIKLAPLIPGSFAKQVNLDVSSPEW